MPDRYRRTKVRRNGNRWVAYWEDRLTGRTFVTFVNRR